MMVSDWICGFFFVLFLVIAETGNPQSPEAISFCNGATFSPENTAQTSFIVSFYGFNRLFELRVAPNLHLFSPKAHVRIYHQDGVYATKKPKLVSFKGIGQEESLIRISKVDDEGTTIQGFFVQEGETFWLAPVSEYFHNSKKRAFIPSGAKFVILKGSKAEFDLEEPIFSGSGNLTTINTEAISGFRKRQDPIRPAHELPWSNCPTNKLQLSLGIVADSVYVSKMQEKRPNENIEDIIANYVNVISGIYVQTFNVEISIAVIDVRTTTTSSTEAKDQWNTGCNLDIFSKLMSFSQWRENGEYPPSIEPAGLFHLLTACYPSGTVGLGWTGVLCTTTSRPQGGNQWVSGTGVSSYLESTSFDLNYRVFAHELGHNFGSSHTPQGLMIASSIKSDLFSVESQKSICNVIYARGGCLEDAPCISECGTQRECGVDRCGNDCGSCPGFDTCNQEGQCEPCVPNCDNKVCGSDNCGGICGPGCNAAENCIRGQCIEPASLSEQRLFLEVHNIARAQHALTPVTWSTEDEQIATQWALGCQWGHSTLFERGNRGENIAAGFTVRTTTDLLQTWTQQRDKWDCLTNKCLSPPCTEYTQITWNETTTIGCHITECSSDTSPFPSSVPWKYLVCSYSSRGNIAGNRPFGVSQCSPSCVPRTCGSVECGVIPNGCGDQLDCGVCGSSSTCNQGKCECVPRQTCVNQNCGTDFDGCGNTVSCGTCGNGEICTNGICNRTACTPITCDQRGFECGEIDNGCGEKNFLCGSCLPPTQCFNGTCVETVCPFCHEFAICLENKQCSCMPGYRGDGYESCRPVGDFDLNDYGWKQVRGPTNSWAYSSIQETDGSAVVLTISTTSKNNDAKVLKWEGSNTLMDLTVATTFGVSIKPGEESFPGEIGIAFGIETSQANDFWTFSYSSDGTLRLTDWTNQQRQSYLIPTKYVPSGGFDDLAITIIGDAITFKIGEVSQTYSFGQAFVGTSFGIYAWNGATADFSKMFFGTSTRIFLRLFDCPTEQEFKQRVASLLGIDPSQITSVEISDCNKRNVEGTGVAFSLVGDPANSALSLSSKLQSYVSSSNPSLSSNSIVPANSPQSVTQSPSATPVSSLSIEGAVAATAGGLTAGAIAGIVIASIVVGGGAVGGSAFVVKKLREKAKENEEKEEGDEIALEDATPKKKKGVNVYNFNSSFITSITGRHPPRRKDGKPKKKKEENKNPLFEES